MDPVRQAQASVIKYSIILISKTIYESPNGLVCSKVTSSSVLDYYLR